MEEFARQVERLRPPGPMSEEKADRFANEAAHEYRCETNVGTGGYDRDREPVTDREVEELTRRRDERRRREGYEPL